MKIDEVAFLEGTARGMLIGRGTRKGLLRKGESYFITLVDEQENISAILKNEFMPYPNFVKELIDLGFDFEVHIDSRMEDYLLSSIEVNGERKYSFVNPNTSLVFGLLSGEMLASENVLSKKTLEKDIFGMNSNDIDKILNFTNIGDIEYSPEPAKLDNEDFEEMRIEGEDEIVISMVQEMPLGSIEVIRKTDAKIIQDTKNNKYVIPVPSKSLLQPQNPSIQNNVSILYNIFKDYGVEPVSLRFEAEINEQIDKPPLVIPVSGSLEISYKDKTIEIPLGNEVGLYLNFVENLLMKPITYSMECDDRSYQ